MEPQMDQLHGITDTFWQGKEDTLCPKKSWNKHQITFNKSPNFAEWTTEKPKFPGVCFFLIFTDLVEDEMTVYIIFYLEYIGEVSQVEDIMEAYGCWEEVLANLLMKTDSCLDEKTTTKII